MGTYILKRSFDSLIALTGVVILVFCMVRFSGDPATLLAPQNATAAEMASIREDLGLDQPIWAQFVIYVQNLMKGDMGYSYRFRQPATQLIFERIPATLQLSLAAFAVSLLISFPIGIYTAVHKGTFADAIGRTIALLGQAMPGFWLALMMILLFSVTLRWLPTSGRGTIAQLIMPAFVLGWFSTASLIRLLRSSMLDVLDSDYIKLARIKGVPEHVIIWKHALKNAAIPIVTILAIRLGHLIDGSVIIETIFAWPGVGQLAVQSIFARDYPVVQAAILLVSATVITSNFLADLVYSWVDPRIRLGK